MDFLMEMLLYGLWSMMQGNAGENGQIKFEPKSDTFTRHSQALYEPLHLYHQTTKLGQLLLLSALNHTLSLLPTHTLDNTPLK